MFKYTDFTDVSGLTLNGNAEQQGRFLLVTPAGGGAGSVWYTNQVNVAQGFLTQFRFKIRRLPNLCPGDGMAFVVQNSSPSALGTGGGWMGYGGISNSLAVEFDTHVNTGFYDPNNNHVGVQSCGISANTPDHGTTCNLGLRANPPVTLSDGNPHAASIGYFPTQDGSGLLSVEIDKQVVLTSTLDLSTLLSLNGDDAWVGFTAGAGACDESHALAAWDLATVGTAGAD